jgi:hypothetical protein
MHIKLTLVSLTIGDAVTNHENFGFTCISRTITRIGVQISRDEVFG